MGGGLIFLFLMGMIVLLLVQAFKANLSHQRFLRAAQLKAEMNSRLLDRVGTDPGILELLKQDSQLTDIKFETESREPSLTRRVLITLQTGTFLFVAGVAFGMIARRGFGLPGDEIFRFFSAIAMSLGIALLVSAVVVLAAGRALKRMHHEAA